MNDFTKAGLVAGAVAIALSTTALADVQVSYNSNGITPVRAENGGGGSLQSGFLVAVYLSPDDSVAGFNSIDPTSPTGGDSFLGYFNSTGSAGDIIIPVQQFNNLAEVSSPLSYTYVALFDTTAASVVGAVDYGLGHTFLTFDSGGLPPPPGQYWNAASPQAVIQTSLTTVPEPGTWSLMVIGALGMVLGARKRFSA